MTGGSGQQAKLRMMHEDEMVLIGCLPDLVSTRRPLHSVLREIMATVGGALHYWTECDHVLHVYTNPGVREAHYLRCGQSQCAEYDREDLVYEPPVGRAALHERPQEDIVGLRPLLKRALDAAQWSDLVLFPFDHRGFPLGHFLCVWERGGGDEETLRRMAAYIFRIQKKLATLLSNHYPISTHTYMPEFFRPGLRKSGVLFADVRGFSGAFEAMRLGGDEYVGLLTDLVRSFLSFSASVVSGEGMGRIHKFMGDGFMATLGEYPTVEEDDAARAACTMCLYAASAVVTGFEDLYETWLEHPEIERFQREFYESISLGVGVGVNYGPALFDDFGNFGIEGEGADLLGGYLEHTAIGDHVNVAKRLESIAGRRLTGLEPLARCSKPRDITVSAPIMASSIIYNWVGDVFDPGQKACVSEYRVEGRPSPLCVWELWPEDVDKLCYEKYLGQIDDGRYLKAVQSPPQPPTHELRAAMDGTVARFGCS